jgi:FtsH-binding integral membrane protein
MFQRYFTLKDEPWATGATCLLFASAALTPLVVPHRLVSTLGPAWMWMCAPFLLVVAGILALMQLKALDTLRQILVVSLMAAAFFLAWAGITLVTGYTVARGALYRIPSLVSLNYFYTAIVFGAISVAAASRYQKRLREISGP